MWATMRVCERVGGLTGQVLGSGGGGVKAWEGVGSDHVIGITCRHIRPWAWGL